MLGRWAVWLATRRQDRPELTTPGSHGLPFEEVSFASAHADQVNLAGWFIPAPQPRGVVLLCPGISSRRGWMLSKAAMLQHHGFASLAFDFRGRGRSGGQLCTLGVREPHDILGAVAYLRTRADCRNLPVVAVGESLGAASLVLAMARTPLIQAAVLEACFTTLNDAIARRIGWLAPWFRDRLLEIAQIDTQEVAPLAQVGQLGRPLLLIHDELDIMCPSKAAHSLLQATHSPRAELWVAPWSPHVCAALAASAEYRSRVVDFLTRECFKTLPLN